MKTLTGPTTAESTENVPATTQHLTDSVRPSRERLTTADAVAAARFLTGQPVDDPAREHVVLEEGSTGARSRGIDATDIRRALDANIDANKYVQRGLLDPCRTRPEAAPTARADLATDARPVLDRVDHELVTAVGAASAALGTATCVATVHRVARREGADLDPLHRQALTSALARPVPMSTATTISDRRRRKVRPSTSVERDRLWQNRFDGLLVLAALLAVTGVALQAVHLARATDIVGFVVASAGWVIFAANAVVMVRVSERPWKWVWSHVFELVVVVVAFPAWPLLLAHLIVLELVPAITVLEAAKLAKLAEALRVAWRRKNVGVIPVVIAAIIVVVAVGAAGVMLES